MEISQVVDQRRRRVRAFIEAHANALARQGVIAASFRHRAGRPVGPYHRLTFRDNKVQRSVYLGTDAELVKEVRAVLENLQEPHRGRRALQRRKKAIRKALTQCRAALRQELVWRGLRLQGHEIRGWHTPGPRLVGTPESCEGNK
jgi:hypothetical protein